MVQVKSGKKCPRSCEALKGPGYIPENIVGEVYSQVKKRKFYAAIERGAWGGKITVKGEMNCHKGKCGIGRAKKGLAGKYTEV